MTLDRSGIRDVEDDTRPAKNPRARWSLWSRWWKVGESRAPRRTVVSASLTTTVALTVLVAVGMITDQTVLIPPLAATTAIITVTPGSPLAQPRHVLGGHLLSCLVCFTVLALGWHGPWAAAVACGAACGLGLLFKVAHPPAMATVVMIMLTEPRATLFTALLATGAALLVLVQLISSRLQREVYPTTWW
ncbi:HPP family protein [Streptomyces sp. NPDC094034]|uniref:HPP family protein n=1 Tax=Streptomyces sp. NPDC094034 TaxID=3155309 RepID=UPI00331F04C1